MTLVTVMRDKYARSWPRYEGGERAYVLPLSAALERSYRSDAHFTAYRSPNERRLCREALDQGVVVELGCIVLDLDAPGHSANANWRRETLDRALALDAVHPGLFYYETRGGARVVFVQAEPTTLRTQADACQWRRNYHVVVAYLERRFGLIADPSCSDWQRCYRLPRATRDGVAPEDYPCFGDPKNIGALVIEPTRADIDAAAARSKKHFSSRRLTFERYSGGGDGLLFHLLRARGAVLGKCPRGGWIVRCPNRELHTDKSDTDATVVYPPASGKILGAINCLHSHCAGLTVWRWLSYFTEAEIEFAGLAAGVRDVASIKKRAA